MNQNQIYLSLRLRLLYFSNYNRTDILLDWNKISGGGTMEKYVECNWELLLNVEYGYQEFIKLVQTPVDFSVADKIYKMEEKLNQTYKKAEIVRVTYSEYMRVYNQIVKLFKVAADFGMSPSCPKIYMKFINLIYCYTEKFSSDPIPAERKISNEFLYSIVTAIGEVELGNLPVFFKASVRNAKKTLQELYNEERKFLNGKGKQVGEEKFQLYLNWARKNIKTIRTQKMNFGMVELYNETIRLVKKYVPEILENIDDV